MLPNEFFAILPSAFVKFFLRANEGMFFVCKIFCSDPRARQGLQSSFTVGSPKCVGANARQYRCADLLTVPQNPGGQHQNARRANNR